jgi:3-hydroxyacyl-[acyl-carrier-protein] dehydratase
MAATPFIDLSTVDLNQVYADRKAIYEVLPHRFEFEQLDAIVAVYPEQAIGIARRDVREDEFWVRGHIPGRPLLPGVLMIESAAQIASYLTSTFRVAEGFLGFARVDEVSFRGTVSPPATMYFIMKLIERRSRRVVGDAQGFVDGRLVFEGRITGMPV